MNMHIEHYSPGTFEKSKKYGLPKGQFFTPRSQWQQGVDFDIYIDILSTNNSTKIRQNSKSFLDMSIVTKKNRFMKKRE